MFASNIPSLRGLGAVGLLAAATLLSGGHSDTAVAGLCSSLAKPNGCVLGVDVKDAGLNKADIKDEAGAEFDSSTGIEETLNGVAYSTHKTVTLKVPSAGTFIINASGYYKDDNTLGTGDNQIYDICSISEANNAVNAPYAAATFQNFTEFAPFAITAAVPKAAAGEYSFYLTCKTASADMLVNASLNAIFVSTRY